MFVQQQLLHRSTVLKRLTPASMSLPDVRACWFANAEKASSGGMQMLRRHAGASAGRAVACKQRTGNPGQKGCVHEGKVP
eukprot:1158138-Pelagomonas_calceolata.AAC.4